MMVMCVINDIESIFLYPLLKIILEGFSVFIKKLI